MIDAMSPPPQQHSSNCTGVADILFAAMGQTSSQLEQPTQVPPATEPVAPIPASPSRKRKISGASLTGSEVLRRELEQSILDDSLDAEPKPRKRKRRKVEEIKSDDLPSNAQPNGLTNAETAAPTPSKSKKSKRRTKEEKDLANALWTKNEAEKTRDRLVNETKVYRNEGQWRSLPNGKYGVKLYKKGQEPVRSTEETNEAEKQLERIGRDLEKAEDVLRSSAENIERLNGTPAKNDTAANGTQPKEVHAADADTTKASPRKKRKSKGAQDARNTVSVESDLPQASTSARDQPGDRKKRSIDVTKDEIEVSAGEKSSRSFPDHVYKYKPEIDSWLASQKPTEKVDKRDVREVKEVAASRKKHARRSRYEDDDEEEYEDDEEDEEDDPEDGGHSKKGQGSKKAKAPRLASHQSASNSVDPPTTLPRGRTPASRLDTGAFTKAEQMIADGVFANVTRDYGYTDPQLRALIKDYRNAGPFKTAIHAALPRRSRSAVRKFVKRRFHPHERGPWTNEQDDALREAFGKWPDMWVKISEFVDRNPEDCRDRWRKQLQFGDKKERGPWSKEEEDMLFDGIKGCLDKIKVEYPQIEDRDEQLALLHWETVAKSLEGRRSAKQCREKAEKIRRRGNAELAEYGEEADQTPHQTSKTRKTGISKRYEQAKKHLGRFEIGDYYDIFTEIHTAFADHNLHFHDEDNTVWNKVAWIHQGSRFNMSRCGGALRRLALETAVENWPKDSKHVRKRLNKSKTIPAKALILANWVEKRADGHLDDLPRMYAAEFLGKTKEEMLHIQRERLVKWHERRTKKQKKGFVSKEKIEDSDAEDAGEAAEVVQEVDESPRGDVEPNQARIGIEDADGVATAPAEEEDDDAEIQASSAAEEEDDEDEASEAEAVQEKIKTEDDADAETQVSYNVEEDLEADDESEDQAEAAQADAKDDADSVNGSPEESSSESGDDEPPDARTEDAQDHEHPKVEIEEVSSSEEDSELDQRSFARSKPADERKMDSYEPSVEDDNDAPDLEEPAGLQDDESEDSENAEEDAPRRQPGRLQTPEQSVNSKPRPSTPDEDSVLSPSSIQRRRKAAKRSQQKQYGRRSLNRQRRRDVYELPSDEDED